MARVLITGSRTWQSAETIRETLSTVPGGPHTLVSGACPLGADAMAEDAAARMGWEIERHPADWNRYGKRAGFIRNSLMVELGADQCFAFIRDNSKGASMTARIAESAGIPTTIFREE